MLNRLIPISIAILVLTGCNSSAAEQDSAIIFQVLSSLVEEGQEVRFDPRLMKPDSRIHTLTSFSNVIAEFEGREEEPFVVDDAISIEAGRKRIAQILGLRLTDHTVDDECAGMLVPIRPDEIDYAYRACPDSTFRSVIYSTVRNVDVSWIPPEGENSSEVRIVRGIELSLTPKGMFSQSVDYYVLLTGEGPQLIDRKRLVIME